MSKSKPRYPIYIPSKNRAHSCQTVKLFLKDDVPFKIVVEPSQVAEYEKVFARDLLLVLPEDGLRLLGARLWIREHSIAQGYDRHWQFDDNIRAMYRAHKGERVYCNSNIGICAVEDFTDRYENIGISGFNYRMFVTPQTKTPYILNCRVYSASLINNRMPHKWRLYYNDDTDICLQVVTNNMCTVLFNAFCVDKITTMVVKGGNTDDLYRGDGRLIMARTLEEVWPEYVKTKWRFGRPQHVVKDSWKCFKTPLKLKPNVNLAELPKVNNYDMKLKQVKEVKSESLKKWLQEQETSSEMQRK